MTDKDMTDKKIAADILIAALSSHTAGDKGLQHQRDDVADEQIERIAKAFTRLYQAVRDCNKAEPPR